MKSSQDAGWNDPPKFSYNESVELTRSPKKNILNKRVPFPINPDATKPIPPFLDPTAPPSINSDLPPPPKAFPHSAGQHKDSTMTNSLLDVKKLHISQETLEKCETNSNTPVETDVNEILSILEAVMKEKEQFLNSNNRRELIKKKLQTMKSLWDSNKLLDEIKKQIFELTYALKDGNKEKANQIHIALMVDHPTVCSEFISAFRQLINADESYNS